MSRVPLSGVNSRFFSVIPLSRFLLKMSRFFAYFELEKMRSRCALLSATQSGPDMGRDKDIPGYRSSGKISVASRRCTAVPVAPPGGELKKTDYRFSRFFVRPIPLFRSLMLTPMSLIVIFLCLSRPRCSERPRRSQVYSQCNPTY